jgi:hypothetical protein
VREAAQREAAAVPQEEAWQGWLGLRGGEEEQAARSSARLEEEEELVA